MPEPTLQVLASRQLLQEVCTLLVPFRDDAVLIGGWVPEIRFPDAFPGHVGSIDVDFAMRVSKACPASWPNTKPICVAEGWQRSTSMTR